MWINAISDIDIAKGFLTFLHTFEPFHKLMR